LIRAVVDPNVFVSAFIGSPDAGPGRLVAAWSDRRFVLVVSPLLLAELAEVLARPKFARWASDGRAEAYVAALAARSEHHADPDEPPSVVRDPKDDYLIALMHAADADLLISLDNDLLDAQLDDIAVLDPAIFLTRVDQAERGAGKAEQFFTGETQAGRELRLFYEHTAYDTFTDETGQVFDNPAETEITGTLDGASIEVFGVTQSMSKDEGDSVTVRTDQGTFTAVAGDNAEASAHRAALRRYMEWRPSRGWNTEVEGSAFEGDEWRFTVLVTNGRVSEHVEIRMSDELAQSWVPGRPTPPPDEMVAEHVAAMLRGATWAKVQEKAQHPTTLIWGQPRR
jgi:putative PIN family toxin of toxin-antitoxin system